MLDCALLDMPQLLGQAARVVWGQGLPMPADQDPSDLSVLGCLAHSLEEQGFRMEFVCHLVRWQISPDGDEECTAQGAIVIGNTPWGRSGPRTWAQIATEVLAEGPVGGVPYAQWMQHDEARRFAGTVSGEVREHLRTVARAERSRIDAQQIAETTPASVPTAKGRRL